MKSQVRCTTATFAVDIIVAIEHSQILLVNEDHFEYKIVDSKLYIYVFFFSGIGRVWD